MLRAGHLALGIPPAPTFLRLRVRHLRGDRLRGVAILCAFVIIPSEYLCTRQGVFCCFGVVCIGMRIYEMGELIGRA